MGGAGSVLATAATPSALSSKLVSVCVYEPNLFSLLLAGNTEEQMSLAEGSVFFEQMMAAATAEDWDMWGKLFYQFWFDGKWDLVEEKAKKILLETTIPHTIFEIQSLIWAFQQGPDLARTMMDTLADLPCKKRMVISATPGLGSKDGLIALGRLLQREAGFEIVHAPVGGHMGPVTHKAD